jgi:hypothetical protein
MPHSFDLAWALASTARKLVSPVPHLPGVGGTLACATWQLGLLDVMHHLIEEAFGLPRIGSGGHEWSKGVDDSPHAREAVAARRKAALLRCQTSHGTDEIVGGYAHFNFFGHHIGAQAGKLIQPEAAFESTQVRFDVPALSVGGQYLFFRYRQGSEQRQQKGIGSIIRSHLPHDQTTRDAGVPGQLGVTSAVFSAGFPCDEAVDPVPQGFPGQALRPHPGQSQHHPCCRWVAA